MKKFFAALVFSALSGSVHAELVSSQPNVIIYAKDNFVIMRTCPNATVASKDCPERDQNDNPLPPVLAVFEKDFKKYMALGSRDAKQSINDLSNADIDRYFGVDGDGILANDIKSLELYLSDPENDEDALKKTKEQLARLHELSSEIVKYNRVITRIKSPLVETVPSFDKGLIAAINVFTCSARPRGGACTHWSKVSDADIYILRFVLVYDRVNKWWVRSPTDREWSEEYKCLPMAGLEWRKLDSNKKPDRPTSDAYQDWLRPRLQWTESGNRVAVLEHQDQCIADKSH